MTNPHDSPLTSLRALSVFLKEIETQFLSKYLSTPPPFGPISPQEVLDVAAYVVLAHGALERFVESLSYWLMAEVLSDWQQKKIASSSTANLLIYHGPKRLKKIEDKKRYDFLRIALEEAKTKYSIVLSSNHGIELSHLHTLFRPLGIDVPSDDVEIKNSLALLVKMRHEWAHQSPTIVTRTPKPAQEVIDTVRDCRVIAALLARKVSRKRA